MIWNAIVNGFKSDFDDFTELEKEVNARARNILLAMIDSRPIIKSRVARQQRRYGIISP